MKTNIRWNKVVWFSVVVFCVSVAFFCVNLTREAHQIGVTPWKLLKHMLKSKPRTVEEIHRRGYEDSEEFATELIENPPASLGKGYGYLQRAIARVHLGKVNEAMGDYEDAKRSDPDRYGRYSYSTGLAYALAEKGEHYRAERVFYELQENFPEYATAGYARFLAKTKNLEYRNGARAVELARLHLSLVEKLTRYDHELLAIALASDEKFAEAIEEAELALELPPANEKIASLDEKRIKKFIQLCKERRFETSKEY